MNRTSVTKIDVGGTPAWALELSGGGRAVVAARGATLLSWDPGIGSSIVAGYDSAEELASGDGARSALLVPFPGRVRDATFTFDDQTIRLNAEDDGHARHGFVSQLEFEKVGDQNMLALRAKHEGNPDWPWSFTVDVQFTLGVGSDFHPWLTVQIRVKNTSATDAPIGIGFHPLLTFPQVDTINDLSLFVPARAQVATSKDLIPLPGEAAYSGIHSPLRLDYIGQSILDQSFVSLVPDEEGVVSTTLRHPVTGEEISLLQEPAEAPVLTIWSADSLARGPRGAIGLEPCSCLPDAVNRNDQQGLVRVRPRDTKSMTATLVYRPSGHDRGDRERDR